MLVGGRYGAAGAEVLVARDGADVADHLRALAPERARQIGAAARRRVLAEHTYDRRAAQVDALLREMVAGAEVSYRAVRQL